MFSTIGAAAVLTAGLWLGTGRLWLWAVSPVAPTPDALFAQLAPAAFAGAAIVFVLMTAVHYALAAADEGRAAAARVLEADIAARETQLRALRAQVNPHFLFNCLHSISALVGQDPTNARRMCLELAEFFRESLRAGAQSHVPLVTEAALVRRYLEIERVRFGDRLRATVDVAADVEQTLVPPLLLQPLAENAVKHGIATLVDGGDVTIAISRRGDRVEVSVENPYDAAERPAGNGMGLANVRARLDASYEGRATFRVQAAGGRFRAAISLPFETTA
jgi:LytS/YehU family sensor histidine kinase